MSFDINKYTDIIVNSVKTYLSKQLSDIVTRLEAVESIEVRHGKDGEKGKDGVDGKDGSNGMDGKDGERGIDGRDGRDGKDGRDGSDGKDAVELDILTNIDFEKSYKKGTYASFNGGLFVAKRDTSGQEGWHCIVNGWNPIKIDFDEDFNLEIGFERSTGEIFSKSIQLPIIIDRGVYKNGESYKRGSAVTNGGSLWIAQRDTDEKPGESDAWRLSVKKGRDGKNGLNGKDWNSSRSKE